MLSGNNTKAMDWRRATTAIGASPRIGGEMKFALSFLLLLLSGGSSYPIHAVTNVIDSAAYQGSSRAKLQLTTRVMDYLSCSRNELTLRLVFTFKNTGRENIILDKGSSIVGRHLVSRDLKGVATKKYEEEGRSEYDAGPYTQTLNVPADMSDFIILAPGEVYEVESGWTRVHFTVNDGSPHSEAGLSFGPHFLRIQVGTWPNASETAVSRMRRQWRDKGFLWTETVTSLPMQFTVDRNRPISNCR
jgi:hypothetical protein